MKKDEAAAGADEIGQLRSLAGLQGMIARRQQNLRVAERHHLPVRDDVDREVMRRLERLEQRPSHMEVVVPCTRQERDDRDSI